jgi:hypothetical protein
MDPSYALVFRPCLALSPRSLLRSSLGKRFIDKLNDLVPQTVVLPQFGGILFSDDLVFRERFQEVQGDKGLRCQIADWKEKTFSFA